MSDHAEHQDAGRNGTEKPGGLGPDGTIPADPDGLGATTTGEQSTFEPEEDEGADDDARPAPTSGDGPTGAAAEEGGDADPMQDAGLGV